MYVQPGGAVPYPGQFCLMQDGVFQMFIGFFQIKDADTLVPGIQEDNRRVIPIHGVIVSGSCKGDKSCIMLILVYKMLKFGSLSHLAGAYRPLSQE